MAMWNWRKIAFSKIDLVEWCGAHFLENANHGKRNGKKGVVIEMPRPRLRSVVPREDAGARKR